MKSSTPKTKNTLFYIILMALMGSLAAALQYIMSPLPNIEPVSILIIVFGLSFGNYVFGMIYVFVLLEGLLFGFHIWWICYLFVWTILGLVTVLLRRHTSIWLWVTVSSLFGLGFGGLCSIIYLFIGGPGMAISWWLSGLYFDLLHCIGNLVISLVAFLPLHHIMELCKKQIKKGI